MEISHPSHLLKYLLELSRESEATQITVSVENGGITELRVADDGKGIENIPAALQQGILQAIAPHCELKITSRTSKEKNGHLYHSMFGHLHEYRDVNCAVGTDICIVNMFFNLPDKYRKLKKDSDERQQIINTICEFYLLYGIAIKMSGGGKAVFQVPAAQRLEECVSFLPFSYYERLLAVARCACGTVYLLKLRGNAPVRILERNCLLPPAWKERLTGLLEADRSLFALIQVSEEGREEGLEQIFTELEERISQLHLGREKGLLISGTRQIERDTFLRAKVIRGSSAKGELAASLDEKELTVTLPDGITIIIPLKQIR